MKTLNYYGHNVTVPDDVTHLAADRDGQVFAFVKEPTLSTHVWWPSVDDAGLMTCYEVECPYLDTQAVDWRDSLKEIKP